MQNRSVEKRPKRDCRDTLNDFGSKEKLEKKRKCAEELRKDKMNFQNWKNFKPCGVKKKKNKKVFLFAALWCITQGVVIEFIQGTPLIKNRSFDVLDIAANVVGVIIALLWINTKHKTN